MTTKSLDPGNSSRRSASGSILSIVGPGARGARIYQSLLIAAGWILLGIYMYLSGESWFRFIFVVTLPLYAVHLRGVWHRESKDLDPMLPLLVMSTFLTCLIAGIMLLF